MSARARANIRLPPEVCRSLFVRNLPFKISAEEMYDIFGKFGAIRQIRIGVNPEPRRTPNTREGDIVSCEERRAMCGLDLSKMTYARRQPKCLCVIDGGVCIWALMGEYG
jgi:hypothetical protein